MKQRESRDEEVDQMEGGNITRIGLLFTVLMLIFAVIGAAVGQFFFNGALLPSMFLFLGIAAVINLWAYYRSDKMILRTYRAKIVTEEEVPRLFNIVEMVASRAGMPMPKVALIPERNPNAFATGRDEEHAVVAATEGLLSLLDDDELEGVIAHEMAHIEHKDMLVMSAAATIGSAISFMANLALFSAIFGGGDDDGNLIGLLLIAITAPIAAMLVQLAISRSREYYADEGGADMTVKPWALANALEKLEKDGKNHPLKRGNPSTSSLFIVNPFKKGGLATLFSTHPPTEERIKRLRGY